MIDRCDIFLHIWDIQKSITLAKGQKSCSEQLIESIFKKLDILFLIDNKCPRCQEVIASQFKNGTITIKQLKQFFKPGLKTPIKILNDLLNTMQIISMNSHCIQQQVRQALSQTSEVIDKKAEQRQNLVKKQKTLKGTNLIIQWNTERIHEMTRFLSLRAEAKEVEQIRIEGLIHQAKTLKRNVISLQKSFRNYVQEKVLSELKQKIFELEQNLKFMDEKNRVELQEDNKKC